jgi:uncharacterized membrane protein
MSDSGFMPDPDEISPDKVAVVAFGDDSRAYEALSALKQLDSDGKIEVVEAALVNRDEDGHVHVKDDFGQDGLVGTASGGLIGLIIGILAALLWEPLVGRRTASEA